MARPGMWCATITATKRSYLYFYSPVSHRTTEALLAGFGRSPGLSAVSFIALLSIPLDGSGDFSLNSPAIFLWCHGTLEEYIVLQCKVLLLKFRLLNKALLVMLSFLRLASINANSPLMTSFAPNPPLTGGSAIIKVCRSRIRHVQQGAQL